MQLRLKDVAARDLVSIARELVRAIGVPVLVNDRTDVAIAAGAAGVHLGSKHDAGAPIGLDEFTRLSVATGIPAVAIGGITSANARSAIEAGAVGVAVISSVFGASDPLTAARELAFAIGM